MELLANILLEGALHGIVHAREESKGSMGKGKGGALRRNSGRAVHRASLE